MEKIIARLKECEAVNGRVAVGVESEAGEFGYVVNVEELDVDRQEGKVYFGDYDYSVALSLASSVDYNVNYDEYIIRNGMTEIILNFI